MCILRHLWTFFVCLFVCFFDCLKKILKKLEVLMKCSWLKGELHSMFLCVVCENTLEVHLCSFVACAIYCFDIV